MNQTIPASPAGARKAPRHELHHDLGFDVTAVRDERSFAKARRHSRLVRVLRLALPAVAIAGALGFAAYTYLGSQPAVDIANIHIDPDGVVMERPQVSGFQNNGQAYRLEAARAIQDNANPERVTLESVDARIGLAADDAANVTAHRGVYDTKAQTLVLSEGITLVTTGGVRATLVQASVDLDGGAVRSDRPVDVQASTSRIRADAMEILDGGRHMSFRGGVRVTITPGPPAPDANRASAGPAPQTTAAAEPLVPIPLPDDVLTVPLRGNLQ